MAGNPLTSLDEREAHERMSNTLLEPHGFRQIRDVPILKAAGAGRQAHDQLIESDNFRVKWAEHKSYPMRGAALYSPKEF